MEDVLKEQRIDFLTWRLLNQESLGNLIAAKKIREELNELKGVKTKVEEQETEEELLR